MKTPVLWEVERNIHADGMSHLAVTNRANGEDWIVCSVSPDYAVRQSDLENARLIAAAPELFEALEEMLVFFGKPKRDEWLNDAAFKEAKKAVDAARSVLAKAKRNAEL